VFVSLIPAFNSTTTIEAGIKIVKPEGYAIAEPNIVSQGNDANSVEFRLGLSGGNTNLNTGNWVHVTVLKNGTTSTLYVDGTVEATGIVDRSPSLNTFDIGNINEHGGQQNRYFPVLIDEVRIWNTARNQAVI
jgi:hypothetical protein